MFKSKVVECCVFCRALKNTSARVHVKLQQAHDKPVMLSVEECNHILPFLCVKVNRLSFEVIISLNLHICSMAVFILSCKTVLCPEIICCLSCIKHYILKFLKGQFMQKGTFVWLSSENRFSIYYECHLSPKQHWSPFMFVVWKHTQTFKKYLILGTSSFFIHECYM